jgi:hypothetical protein
LTKSYQDGIIDAYLIVKKWEYVGIQPSIVDTILKQLSDLLPPEKIINLNNITNEPKKSLENGDIDV